MTPCARAFARFFSLFLMLAGSLAMTGAAQAAMSDGCAAVNAAYGATDSYGPGDMFDGRDGFAIGDKLTWTYSSPAGNSENYAVFMISGYDGDIVAYNSYADGGASGATGSYTFTSDDDPEDTLVSFFVGGNGPPMTIQIICEAAQSSPLPTVTLVSPNKASTLGSVEVTLQGTGLGTASAVTFGGTPSLNGTIFVDSDGQIRVTAPAHAAGAVDVVVTTDNGAVTVTDGFTYMAAPVISTVTPAVGPTSGGTTVTLTGTGLSDVSSVTFKGAAATVHGGGTDTSITVTTPARSAGTGDISVETPYGFGDKLNGFTYVAAPTLDSVTPNAIVSDSPTSVTLTGANLTGATSVMFGSQAGSSVVVDNSTSVTVTTPGLDPGFYDVTITTPGGTSPALIEGLEVKQAAPTLTSLTPQSGPTSGGTEVTLTGTNLKNIVSVSFGGVEAVNLNANLAGTSMTVDTQANTAGVVDVTISTWGGDDTLDDAFEYVVAQPQLTGLSDQFGSTSGGYEVTLTGSGLLGASSVTFGGVAATNIVVNDDTSVTVTVPQHVTGNVDVAIVTPGGSSTLANYFVYLAPQPKLTSLSPDHGPTAGGTLVTITGKGLLQASGVTFDNAPGTDLTLISDTQISIRTPDHPAGAVDVAVSTPGGDATLETGFVYDLPAAPQLDTVTPDHGPVAGGTPVTLTGTGFTGTTEVKLGGTPLQDMVVVDDETITGVTPPHAAGAVDVELTGNFGNDMLAAAFTYDAADIDIDLVRETFDALSKDFVTTRSRLLAGAALHPGLRDRRDGAPTVSVNPDSNQIEFGYSAGTTLDYGGWGEAGTRIADQDISFWIDASASLFMRGPDDANDWGSFALLSAGADMRVNERLLLGVAAHADWMEELADSTVRGAGVLIGPYVSAEVGDGVFLDASLLYGRSWNEASADGFSGDFETDRLIATAKLKGDWQLTDALTLSPSVSAFYLHESTGGYSVDNGQGDSVGIPGFSEDQLRLSAGGVLSYALDNDGMAIVPYAGLELGLLLQGGGSSTGYGKMSAGVDLQGPANWRVQAGVESDLYLDGLRSLAAKASVTGAF